MTEQTFFAPPMQRELIAARVSRFIQEAIPGKPLEIIVRQKKREYTDQQRKALFGHAYKHLMAFQGMQGEQEKQELHTVLCGMRWGWTEYRVLGQLKKRPRRTTTRDENGQRDVLKWDALADFYDFVTRTAAKLGCYIPDPDPEWFLKPEHQEAA